MIQEFEFIIYVSNQKDSAEFYEKLLQKKPSLNIKGITEFLLFKNVKFGIMPENGIGKIISKKTKHPKLGNGIPRCELYIKVKNVEEYIKRGIKLGAKEIDKVKLRDWGDKVGYIADIDGHIIAFAEKI